MTRRADGTRRLRRRRLVETDDRRRRRMAMMMLMHCSLPWLRRLLERDTRSMPVHFSSVVHRETDLYLRYYRMSDEQEGQPYRSV